MGTLVRWCPHYELHGGPHFKKNLLIFFSVNPFAVVHNKINIYFHAFMQMAETSLDVDDRVMSKMKGLFDEGVRKVGEMQRRIRDYVTSEIFQGNNTPLQSDGRFCPSRKAIQNCLYRCQVKAR